VDTLPTRAIYPIPKDLNPDKITIEGEYMAAYWPEKEWIAHVQELPTAELKAQCAKKAGHLGWLAWGCTYVGEERKIIVLIHPDAPYAILEHEAAHAIAFKRGWSPSTLTDHYGLPPLTPPGQEID
jgi:hypothetical protein